MAKGVKLSDTLVDVIINNYKNKKSPYWMVENIEELKNVRPSVIYGILKREGVKSNRRIVLTEEQRKSRRKYNLNDDYFENIDSADKAYWLGFIMADGWITDTEDKVGITLSIKDLGHLEKFKNSISASAPINTYTQTAGYAAGKEYCRIVLTSKKLKNDLINHGVVVQKTNVLKFPKHVDEKYYIDIIRGYFDGDGSITYGSIQKCGDLNFNIKITGTHNVVSAIQSILNVKSVVHQRHKDRNVDNWTMTIGGNKKVYSILNSFYEDSNIYLDRKHDIYLKLKQQIHCRL